MQQLIRSTAVALALAGGVAMSFAQTGGTSGPITGNDHAEQPISKSDQGGKQEPTVKPVNEPPPNPQVLIDGKLNVPGAPQDTDTVPAKFSEKNDADDKVIIVGYAFKYLSEDQRQKIYDAVKGARSASASVSSDYTIGAELPADVELAPFPPEVTAAIPQTEKYGYVTAGDKVLLVAPNNKIVVGEIAK